MSMLHVHVYAECPCPCCVSISLLHVHIYAACPCPCCMSMSLLHVHVHAACPCPCCMPMSMLHGHGHKDRHRHGHAEGKVTYSLHRTTSGDRQTNGETQGLHPTHEFYSTYLVTFYEDDLVPFISDGCAAVDSPVN